MRTQSHRSARSRPDWDKQKCKREAAKRRSGDGLRTPGCPASPRGEVWRRLGRINAPDTAADATELRCEPPEFAERLACVSQSPVWPSPQTPRPSKRALLLCRLSSVPSVPSVPSVRLDVRLHLAKSLQTDCAPRNARGVTSPRANSRFSPVSDGTRPRSRDTPSDTRCSRISNAFTLNRTALEQTPDLFSSRAPVRTK